jgi:hypothetical protein
MNFEGFSKFYSSKKERCGHRFSPINSRPQILAWFRTDRKEPEKSLGSGSQIGKMVGLAKSISLLAGPPGFSPPIRPRILILLSVSTTYKKDCMKTLRTFAADCASKTLRRRDRLPRLPGIGRAFIYR